MRARKKKHTTSGWRCPPVDVPTGPAAAGALCPYVLGPAVDHTHRAGWGGGGRGCRHEGRPALDGLCSWWRPASAVRIERNIYEVVFRVVL